MESVSFANMMLTWLKYSICSKREIIDLNITKQIDEMQDLPIEGKNIIR